MSKITSKNIVCAKHDSDGTRTYCFGFNRSLDFLAHVIRGFEQRKDLVQLERHVDVRVEEAARGSHYLQHLATTSVQKLPSREGSTQPKQDTLTPKALNFRAPLFFFFFSFFLFSFPRYAFLLKPINVPLL